MQQEASKPMDHMAMVRTVQRMLGSLGQLGGTDLAWGMVELLSERGHIVEAGGGLLVLTYPGHAEWQACRALAEAGEWE